MNRFLPAISFLILAFIFAGCSGGDSAPSQDSTPVQISSPGSVAGSVTITNTALQFSETTSVSATFKKTDGTPASGANVNFSTTLGTITPASGIAVADANGTATVQLTVGATSGQGQITASATVENKQVTKTGLFSVSLPPLKLSAITLGLSTLSYGGSTGVSVTVTDANGVIFAGQEVDVTFSSTQAASGKATLTSPTRTVNGVATVTYQATTATGSDTITAAIAGDSKTSLITVNPLAASAVTFVSASPANIGLKGMGGAGIQETSKVTFKVLDTAGQPKANQQVDFALNTSIGGLALSQASGSTAADGAVSTIVQAGVIATTVRVTATIRGVNPMITTQSDLLVISTGIPAQDSMSLSFSNLNPEACEYDGVIVGVTARLSDHFHNPVPDGTAVYFTTSEGAIQPSCTTIGGGCVVNWISQNPRPNCAPVILAYAIGEESFLDTNGNGVADAVEFIDDSEAFRDDNFDRIYTAPETYIDFNANGVFNGPDGKYNGVLQGAGSVGAPQSKHVFLNARIIASSSTAGSLTPDAVTLNPGTPTNPSVMTVSFTLKDNNGHTMPSGTVVASTQSGSVVTISPASVTVPQQTSFNGFVFPLTITNPNASPGTTSVAFSVTSPKGIISTFTTTFTW